MIMANVREIEMETLQIPNSVKEMLLYIEGKSIKDKLVPLIMSDLENRFRTCTERLYEFEKNIGWHLISLKKLGRQI